MAKNIFKYGVVGFSRNQFDKKAAHQILEELFHEMKNIHKDQEVEIVSGYTNSGVPKIAYELADQFSFTTVGYSAEQALQVKSGVYPVKKVFIKGKRFGDESEEFIGYIDALVRVGGGPQSRKEVEMFKQLHADKNLDDVLKEFEVEWRGSV